MYLPGIITDAGTLRARRLPGGRISTAKRPKRPDRAAVSRRVQLDFRSSVCISGPSCRGRERFGVSLSVFYKTNRLTIGLSSADRLGQGKDLKQTSERQRAGRKPAPQAVGAFYKTKFGPRPMDSWPAPGRPWPGSRLLPWPGVVQSSPRKAVPAFVERC